MKIAHVVESLEVGGAERVVLTLCRLQKEAGHDVSVHCLSHSGPLAEQLGGVPVYVHDSSSKWRLFSGLYKAFRKTRPQVVHCHNVAATIFGAPPARVAGAECVLSTRHGSISPRLKRQVLFWLSARWCDYIVAVGESTKAVLASERGALHAKIISVRNAASEAPICPAHAPIDKKGFTLLMVARMAPPKDPMTLVRAVGLASCKAPDLHLWLLGDGALLPSLKRLASRLGIEDRITFLGERHDVGNWLGAADVFVLSSTSEGVPISLLEAMAARLPSIVTRVGGMREVAELSRSCLVVNAGDPVAMAEAIVRWSEHRQELSALGQLARRCYEEHFLPQRWADNYLKLYRHPNRSANSMAPEQS